MKYLASLLLLVSFSAHAAEPAKGPPQLTVLEALNAGNALRQLGPYPEVMDGKQTGRMIQVPFEFNGTVMMNIATDIAGADQAQRNYQKFYQELFNKYAKVTKDDKGNESRTVPAESMAEFNDKTSKAMEASAGQVWAYFNVPDLCMDKRDNCKGADDKPIINHISPSVLSALLPLVVR